MVTNIHIQQTSIYLPASYYVLGTLLGLSVDSHPSGRAKNEDIREKIIYFQL